MKTEQLLTRHVATARRTDRLLDAVQRMREEHVGALVVVEEAQAGLVPVGMLTDRDIVVGVFAKDFRHVPTLEVGDVMSANIVTATEDEDVVDVTRRMRFFGVRRVPVVDDRGVLSGILALDDVYTGISDQLVEAASLGSRQRDREPARRPA